ncbi:MAG: glycosyltransferase family 2 protein [Patescibacteria group bacterium]|jgi:hypothetical protein|nr:glycosyltransferase family 2 protein [Patescibacteria group bacterium]MDD5172637.1 glycosyltransferase family 2 protein [Patescibacteria group bacterium]
MTLSIIIVSWNVKALLERCLDSVFRNLNDLEAEILVVDNNSQDGSQEYLKSRQSYNLKIILNNRNFGFSQANNQALKQAKGEYILFLNPDTEIIDDVCRQAIQLLQQNKDWGLIGCQLIGPDNRIQSSVRTFPSVGNQLILLLKLQYLLPGLRTLKRYFRQDFNYDQIAEVDQVAGAFMMTKKEVLEQIGSFDERFHLWFEDVDFCYRLKQVGYKIIYYPRRKVIHYGGQSFNQLLSKERQKIYNHSLRLYFKKHFPPFYYWPIILVQPLSLFLARLSEVFSVTKKEQIKKRLKVN